MNPVLCLIPSHAGPPVQGGYRRLWQGLLRLPPCLDVGLPACSSHTLCVTCLWPHAGRAMQATTSML
jgi:hypothetical protein